MSTKPICVLQAPIYTRSGYGDWALAVAKSLLRYDKFDLRLAPTVWGACSKKNLDGEVNDPEGKLLLSKIINAPLPRQPELFIQMTIPNEFVSPAKFNIGMTAGIETTVSKPEWIEGLNRMNLNIVTSVHSKDVFVHSNYTKTHPNGATEPLNVKSPIEVLFWGADTNIFHKTTDKIQGIEDVMSKIPEKYGFLFVGQWTSGNMRADRKGIGFLIKTFLETFRDVNNPPCLILKTSGAQICIMDKYECISKINDVTQMVQTQFPDAKLPNVYLIHGELTEQEMNALFNHEKVKTHVSFTHGEGFGHPLLLATLSGKPVLSPHWSGHLDFLNPKFCKFFEGKLSPLPPEAVNEWFVKESQWFEVDYNRASEKMKTYFHHYGGKMIEDAENLRLENMEKFSMAAMDKAFHAILDQYVPKFAMEESIILPSFSTSNNTNTPSLPKLKLKKSSDLSK